MNQIIQRAKSPTPNFFRKLRNIGLVLAAIGTAVITAPISLPAVVITVGGYLTVAGTVASAVSQLTEEPVRKATRKTSIANEP